MASAFNDSLMLVMVRRQVTTSFTYTGFLKSNRSDEASQPICPPISVAMLPINRPWQICPLNFLASVNRPSKWTGLSSRVIFRNCSISFSVNLRTIENVSPTFNPCIVFSRIDTIFINFWLPGRMLRVASLVSSALHPLDALETEAVVPGPPGRTPIFRENTLFSLVDIRYPILQGGDGLGRRFCRAEQISCCPLALRAGVEGNGEGMDAGFRAGCRNL